MVLMGNNNAYKTKGIGKVKLQMFDGAVRVLNDVRYVLGWKKNLILLGARDSKGFKITMKDGVLKVGSESMVVMKGGET